MPSGDRSRRASTIKMGYGALTVSGAAIWRTTRCRTFDANGNVTGYGFTLNPAWHKVEAVLRCKIKPQQPPLAGLTEAEKAIFNWASIVELAARNDFILPNGNPRFMGNYIFAADGTLADKLEIMQRADRSIVRVQNGQIYMFGNDTRSSIFLMGANHVVPGSVRLEEKDISRAPNIFIPTYRDLGIPAVSQVVQVVQSSPGQPLGFTLSGPDPFLPYGVFTYGGSSDPTLDGDFDVGNYVETTSSPPNITPGNYSGTYSGTATGGYLGSNDARFSQRAPVTVQHRSAQLMMPAQAPGVAAGQPNLVRVRYDFGASTYDQTNRLMKFERDSTLGTDIGAGWTPPATGTLTAYLECVDANDQPLISCGQHDVISLDDWVCPESPGDYEIMSMQIIAPSAGDLGSIVLQLRQYNPNAPTDVSDPPGDSYQDVPNDGLQLSGFAQVTNPAWVLQATPQVTVAGDGSLTVTVPDLMVQVMGQPVPTSYPASSWTEVPPGSPALLYIDDPSGTNAGSTTYQLVTGTAPLASPPAGIMLAFSGTFVVSGSGSGPMPAIYSPAFPLLGT